MRVKYDVKGVQTGAPKPIPPGMYNAKITQADVTKPDNKDERIELVLECQTKDEFNGHKLFEYINLESEVARWKLREFLEAVGVVQDGKKESGTFDTDKMIGKIIGVKTVITPADEKRGYPEKARAQRMFALENGATAEEPEELDEPEPSVAADDEGDYDLENMSRSELKQVIKDEELDIKVKKSMSDDDIRKLVEDQLYEEEDEEESEEESEDEEAEEPEASEEEGDEEGADDYDDWSLDDLRTELEQRSLSTKGGKKTMIAKLRKDDAEEDKPF
jgi:hypothetical protein